MEHTDTAADARVKADVRMWTLMKDDLCDLRDFVPNAWLTEYLAAGIRTPLTFRMYVPAEQRMSADILCYARIEPALRKLRSALLIAGGDTRSAKLQMCVIDCAIADFGWKPDSNLL